MIVDLHCDTISEIYKNKGISLKENDLMIDISKLKNQMYFTMLCYVYIFKRGGLTV